MLRCWKKLFRPPFRVLSALNTLNEPHRFLLGGIFGTFPNKTNEHLSQNNPELMFALHRVQVAQHRFEQCAHTSF